MGKFRVKKLLLAVAIGTMVIGATGCGTKTESSNGTENAVASEKTTQTNGELKEFRVGCGDATNNQLNDLAQVAQNNGYLEEELNKVGYTLKVTGFQGQGPEINAAIMSGSLNAGNYAEFPSYTSKASGADTTIVAVTDPQLLYGILAKDENIKTVKDLEGKKIVVQQGTSLQYVWNRIVDETGIDESKVEVINSNVVDGLSLVQTGDADAVLSSASSVQNFENQGQGHAVEGINADVAYTVTLFNVSNKILQESPDVAVAINKALIRSYEEVKNDPEKLYSVLGSRYGEKGADVIKDTYTINGSLDYISPEINDDFFTYMNDTYAWMKDKSLLAKDIDPNTYIDRSYYEKAVEELGE